MMKPTSKLFQDTTEQQYAAAFKQLYEMRKKHPAYRDDDLLIYLLAKTIKE